jgi:hypothetical protein
VSGQVHVDTERFNAAMRQLSRLTGASMKDVIRSEMAGVLGNAVKFTKAAGAAKIRASARKRHEGAQAVKMDGKIYYKKNRYKRGLWNAIKRKERANIKRDIDRRIAARGWAKRSWVLLAARLGINAAALKPTIAGYVLRALPRTGQTHPDNYDVSEATSGARYSLTLENANPSAVSFNADGSGALRRALAGRVKFLRTNLEKDVFATVAGVASRYGALVRKS